MKILIRIILTPAAMLIFGVYGVMSMWRYGGAFTLNTPRAEGDTLEEIKRKVNQISSQLEVAGWFREEGVGSAARVKYQKLGKALRLLRSLADEQNGPPLERERDEYEQIMKEVYDFLNEHNA